jgi:hypothetical protein
VKIVGSSEWIYNGNLSENSGILGMDLQRKSQWRVWDNRKGFTPETFVEIVGSSKRIHTGNLCGDSRIFEKDSHRKPLWR